MVSKLPPKRSGALSAHEAFDRILSLREGRDARRAAAIAEVAQAERDAEDAVRNRVPEEHRPRLDTMLVTHPQEEEAAGKPQVWAEPGAAS